MGLGLLASVGAARSARKVRRPTAMSEWTPEQFRHWADTMKANGKGDSRRTSAEVLALLEKSAQIDDGSGVTQKEHCLQTATRALRDGADEELVVAALFHDFLRRARLPVYRWRGLLEHGAGALVRARDALSPASGASARSTRSMTRCRWLTSSRWSAASSTGVSSPRPGRRRSQPHSLRAAERRAPG